MRDELIECPWGYEESLTYLFRELLIHMRRRMLEKAPKVSGLVQEEIDRAKIYFRDHYNEDISIEAYAVSRNMSTSWFGKSFAEAVGESPKKYLTGLRIRNAQVLLETTDGTIAEIAHIVGYDNPLYFSRVFRNAAGLSPQKYRRVYREKLLQSVKSET